MASTTSEIGVDYEVPIERGAIRSFAKAMQSRSSAYEGEGAIIPPIFLISAWQWAPEGGRVRHGIPRARLLHGEQEFIFHGKLPTVGETLMAREQISERFEKQGRRGGIMEFVVIVTQFSNSGGDIVAEMKSTFIGREAG